MLTLRLKPHEDRRLRAGHLWAYSNELSTGPEFRQIAPGSPCVVLDSRGKPLGQGYVNPHALLSVRLLTSNANAQVDAEWFARRIRAAQALRERLYPSGCYRLVFGESDGLPGLVIDRYRDVCVVQLGTAGMEARKDMIVAGLEEALAPAGIVFRNDTPARELEGLPSYVETLGEVPGEIEIDEGGARFAVPLQGGQKTGWFYDQRDNRARAARYVRGASVLDVFSYAGGWAVRALRDGAARATCIDSSQPALDLAARNAALNDVQAECIRDDALDAMKALRAAGRTFDVVVVDPPALIKRKKDYEAGVEHYAALNRAALQLLSPDGILVSCSCSHHLDADALQRVLLRESRTAKRRLQVLEQGGQAADHPVHPAIPETRYLKAFFCRATQG